MIRYPAFFRKFVVRRVGDLSTVINISDITELPQGAVLHVIDNFNRPFDEEPLLVPDVNNPLYKLTAEKKLVLPVTRFVHHPIATEDKGIRILGIGVDRALLNFRQEFSPNIRLISSNAEFRDQMNTQNIVSYNSLFRVRANGMMKTYRLVNNILATVLNTAAADPERTHFIHIPLSSLTFTRTDFQRSFKEHSRSTIKSPDSTHYLFLMHLYSFIESHSTTSLFEGLGDAIWANINFVLTVDDRALIYRMDVLKEINGPANNSLLRIIEQVNKLSPFATEDVPKTDTAPAELTKIAPSPDNGLNTTGFSVQPSIAAVTETSKKNIEKLDKASTAAVEKLPNITPAQKERAKKVATVYKEVEIAGVPIESILLESNDHTVEGGQLDFLPDPLIAATMKKSSIDTFDTEYMQKTFKKDIAAIVSSFGSQGMFLVGHKTEDKSDDQSNLEEHTAFFEDATGKKHNIRYTFPKVDKNGLCKINGQLKSMKLQRVNVPIVKDSATRVLLNSNFNKTLVERNQSLAHSFYAYLKRMLSKAEAGSWGFDYGTFEYNDIPLPYEYSAIAEKMARFYTKDFQWTFDYHNRFHEKSPMKTIQPRIDREKVYGVYLGSGGPLNTIQYYLSTSGDLTKWDDATNSVIGTTTIIDEIAASLKIKPTPLTEWVDFKVLAKKVTVAFALCYRFGLTHMLKYLNADYALYDINERVLTKVSDVVIRFLDKKLVISSTPKHVSLIFSGLAKYPMLKNVMYEAMDSKDVYYDIIQSERLSTNYIKGIDSIFELFIDPITADILTQMGEPTNMKDLLIRATVLLTTQDHLPRASSANFRYRSYERFAAIAYKKMARALATYQNGSIGAGKKFSLSQYDILTEIMKDPLMESVDTINPIHDLKSISGYSHIGEGGRSSEAMVIADRQFPDDAVGIMSEATVDSGKVAIDGALSVDPTIVNTRGLTITKPISELSAANILSVTSLLLPSADQDDGKRAK